MNITSWTPRRNLLYDRADNDPYLQRLANGSIPLYFGRSSVVTDPPVKLKRPIRQGGQTRILAETLLQKMQNARDEVLPITPYFVPENWGADFFSRLSRRGVRVRIVTNSLASTNHAYVHAGYKRHRKALLQAGVELYEVHADALQVLGLVAAGDETGITMHTKVAIIDDRHIYVGSTNFDPRSIKQNTEMGVFTDLDQSAPVRRNRGGIRCRARRVAGSQGVSPTDAGLRCGGGTSAPADDIVTPFAQTALDEVPEDRVRLRGLNHAAGQAGCATGRRAGKYPLAGISAHQAPGAGSRRSDRGSRRCLFGHVVA
jgi:phosphatidylserine/phosphatidylglycerophosphate/cardiolipin synthase-like enzyme